jgi:hypothetical protein
MVNWGLLSDTVSNFFQRVTFSLIRDRNSQREIFLFFFVSHHTVQRLDIIKFFYSPTDAQVNCPKNNFKIYVKIYIKTALTFFGAIVRERIIRAC